MAWVRGQSNAWRLERLVAELDDGSCRCALAGGTEFTTRTWHRHDPSHDADWNDIGQMSDLHEAPLLRLLARRFARDALAHFQYTSSLSIVKKCARLHMLAGGVPRIAT